jgi:hypothetical protein
MNLSVGTRSRLFGIMLTLFLVVPTMAQAQATLKCDADFDGDIDRDDIALIAAARNQLATGPDDPRDADNDGRITVLDARVCTLRCTLPRCVVPPPPPVNNPPVANAGPDQSVFVGSLVTLDGSASSDPDGDALIFAWRFLSRPDGSAAELSDVAAVRPTFPADAAGSFVVELVVNDGQADSAPDTVTINIVPVNTDPVANAGPDQNAFVGAEVTLDGSASSDVDGDPLSFAWQFLSLPPGSGAALQGADTASPRFTPDLRGQFVVELTVEDGRGGTDSDQVTVSTEDTDRPPVADAGPDQSVLPDEIVYLDGSASFDADLDPITAYQWNFLSRPDGSTATLSNADTVAPFFVADGRGDFVVQLIVTANEVASAPDTVVITTENVRPVADAGPNQSVMLGETVNLDGSASSDANDDALSFSWSITSRPTESTAVLSNEFTPFPSFETDAEGLFVIQLIVSDGLLDSVPDTTLVTVNVEPNEPPVAVDDTATTPMDTSVLIDVLANDSDPDGDPLTIVAVTQPANGTAEIEGDQVRFTPETGFAGETSFGYTIEDGRDGSASATVTVTVTAVNQAPVADAGADQSVLRGETVQLDGSGSSDPEGVDLSFAWSFESRPDGSSATLEGAASATPSFVADVRGNYVVSLIVNDGELDSAPDTVTITAGNNPPVANDDTATTVAGEPVLVDVLANDTDADGDTLTVSAVTQPATSGSVAIVGEGAAVEFTPADGFDGEAAFTYTIDDGNGGTDSANVTVTVTAAPNQPPVADAGPDQVVFIVDAIQLDGSASSDPDGDPLTYLWTVQSAPTGATVGFAPDATVVNPVVSVSDTGTYVFRLVVNDSVQDSAPDDVTVVVNGVPSLSIDDVSLPEGDSGTSDAVFTVSISGPIDRIVTVDYTTADGTATAGEDYVATSGTLVFPANSTDPQTITVQVVGDTQIEPDETFFVDLSNPTNATIDRARGSGNILNDDSPFLVSLAPNPLEAVTRETRNMTVTITVPAPVGGLLVELESSDPDIATVPGSVTIAEGGTNANFNVTTLTTTGTATITATVAESTPATSTVQVTARTLSITLQSNVVGTGRSLAGRIILANPAPEGGTTVALEFDPTGIASASPASLDLAAGQTQLDFTLSGVTAGQTTLTASAAGYTSQATVVTVTNNIVSLNNAALNIGRDMQVQTGITASPTAPAGGLLVRVSSGSPNVLISTSGTLQGTQSVEVLIPQGTATGPALFIQNVGQSSGSTQLLVEVLTESTPAFAPGNPATVNLLQSGFELYCSGCAISGNNYTLDTTTQATPTLLYFQTSTLTADLSNNRLGAQQVRGGFTAVLSLSSVGDLGEYRVANNFTPGAVITELPIASGTNFTYFYFDPNNTSAGGSGTIGYTVPTGFGVPVQSGSPYLQSIPLTVAATPVSFSATTLNVGRDMQTGVSLQLPGPAPAGGLTVRVNSNSPNVLISAVATAAGTQSLEVAFAAGSNNSGPLYVQNVGQSSGTAQLTVEILTTPNPGYAPGNPATVNLLQSGFELYCSGCAISGNNYTLDTTTQATPTLLYFQTSTLTADLSNNRLGAQQVRGGFTAVLSLSSVGDLGEYRVANNFTPGAVITELPIASGTNFTYFYFDPNNTSAGGSGTIGYTVPTGFGVPVQSGSPYLQSIPLTVAATPVSFSATTLNVGRDMQTGVSLQLPGPAPAGGLTVRVNSNSPNVLISAVATAAGTQSLEVAFAAGSNNSGPLYVQNVGQSSGTAQLTVEILTTPNPGYAPGNPATVNLLQSGFELYCSGCAISGNNYTLDTTTQATPTLLYFQTSTLTADLSNNRLGAQQVRGGFTAVLSLSSVGDLGEYRVANNFTPGAVITELPIASGTNFTYFYFDPNNTSAGGSGTIGYTVPTGFGVPVQSGSPYLQSIPLTVAATPVSFSATTLNVGRDMQTGVSLQLPGPAPAGGLTVRVNSNSPNVLISAVATAAGTQSLEVAFAAGSNNSGPLYVQNVGQSSGTAQLTVEILTTPNPGYAPGNPATVNLLQSGFELYCSGCAISGNNYTLDTTTQATPTLLYFQTSTLTADLSNNRLGAQQVRGGFTAVLSLSSVGDLGEYRVANNFTPGAVITELPIAAGTNFTYFYFDPNNTSAGGSGTIGYTVPTGFGVPVQSGSPYLQSIPLTVTN